MKKDLQLIKPMLLAVTCILFTACASIDLSEYDNITVSENKEIETIQFFNHQSSSTENIKWCILENVKNEDIPIEHAIGVWATLFPILVLIPNEEDVIERGDVIISDEDGVLKASGNLELEKTLIGMDRSFLTFFLTANGGEHKFGTELIFRKPSLVFKDPGYGRNRGEIQLRTNIYKSIFDSNYSELEEISDRVFSCLQNT